MREGTFEDNKRDPRERERVEIVKGKLKVPELFGQFSDEIMQNKGSNNDNNNDVLLRGSSFRKEVKTGWQCNLIKQLINKIE